MTKHILNAIFNRFMVNKIKGRHTLESRCAWLRVLTLQVDYMNKVHNTIDEYDAHKDFALITDLVQLGALVVESLETIERKKH